jgi:phosphoglycerate dehydrogenase-like enzyme
VQALSDADVVVLALALTDDTTGLIGARELAAMRSDAWLVNVARGAHVDTDALVEALDNGRIGGAALDVTSPEPLPPDHPLWTQPNCLITPHTANTPAMMRAELATLVTRNVALFAAGRSLLGVVDPAHGY